MSKTVVFMGFLLCCILVAGQSFALSDAEFNSLAKSSADFRQADKDLNKYWKDTIGNLDGAYKKQVLNDQRQWVKSGWDKSAQNFMAQGMSKSAAYTKAIHERINQLRVIQENSNLGENEMGTAKADDYYNGDDSEKQQNTTSDKNQKEKLPIYYLYGKFPQKLNLTIRQLVNYFKAHGATVTLEDINSNLFAIMLLNTDPVTKKKLKDKLVFELIDKDKIACLTRYFVNGEEIFSPQKDNMLWGVLCTAEKEREKY